LEKVDVRFKNLKGGSNKVNNNNDVVHVIICHNRDETYADGHKLGFDRCDIHGSTLELFCDVVVIPDMGYSICNIGFFNPTVYNNGHIMWGILTKDLIEVLNMFMNIFRRGEERRMKGYSTREMIDYS